MVNKTFAIALDMKRATSVQTDFTVVEGDNGNALEITLTDDGNAVNLTGCRVLAIFGKPDGTTVEQDTDGNGVTVEGNVISIELYTGSFAPAKNGTGQMRCEIQVYSGEDYATLVTSANFTFKCRRSIMNDDTIQSTEAYPILTSLIAQVEGLGEREQPDWNQTDTARGNYIRNKPASYAPSAHRLTHAADGVDALTFADIGAAAASHAFQHRRDGADAITPASIGAAGVSAIYDKTLLAAGWADANAVSAETNVSGGAVTVDADAFAEAVSSEAGTYTFAYDGTNAYWTLEAAEVSLADYGVALTGAPNDANTVTVIYAREAPYRYTLAVAGVTETTAVEVLPSLFITEEQQEELQALRLLDGGQAAESVTLKTFMEKPTLDIPIRVIVRGDL